jgi:hypothetical protein
MYQVEGEIEDYALPLEVEGFEVTDEDVMVFQQREFEEADPMSLALAAEAALNDLSGVAVLQMTARQALDSKDVTRARTALNLIQVNNIRLAKIYQPGMVPAMESMRFDGNVLEALALETSDEKKGFFQRIIDSIVNAFKWLWKKLSQLFSSNESTEKGKDALGKIKINVKSLGEIQKEADSLSLDLNKRVLVAERASIGSSKSYINAGNQVLLRHFGFLGDDISADDVIKNLGNAERSVSRIRDAFIKGCISFKSLNDLVGRYSEGTAPPVDKVPGDMSTLFQPLNSVMSSLPTSQHSELLKKGVVDSRLPVKTGSERRVVGFLNGAELFTWISEWEMRDGSDLTVSVPGAAFYKPQHAPMGVSIDALSSDQAALVSDLIESIVSKVESTSREAASVCFKNEEDMEKFRHRMTTFQMKAMGNDEFFSNILSTVSNVGRGINRVTLSSLEAERNITGGYHVYADYVSLSLSSAKKALDELKKEKSGS